MAGHSARTVVPLCGARRSYLLSWYQSTTNGGAFPGTPENAPRLLHPSRQVSGKHAPVADVREDVDHVKDPGRSR